MLHGDFDQIVLNQALKRLGGKNADVNMGARQGGSSAPARTGAVQAYEFETADALRARFLAGDALDIYHVGQARPLEELIPGYNRATGPAIVIPEQLHRAIPSIRGATNLTPRQILANDIRNLRNFTDAPNSSLWDLIELNKQTYPGAFGK